MAGSSRVILHLDFDCYYAQVEMKRLGIPRDTPCAVQQWEGLIAVNYPARDRGVTRHMRVAEAKKLCPEIRLVHVETIGAEGEGSGQGAGEEDPSAYQHKRLTQKASLERYRRSTAEVLALLHRLAPQAVIEKASIDEVYMDVTAMIDRELQAQASGSAQPSTMDAFGWGSVVVGGPLDVDSEFERRLAKGAEIACRLRGALLSELGYTSSAGIACNKLLAKVGSALHKPNQQTVIPPRAVDEVMRPLPLKKLRNFGGKLGAELEEIGCATAGEVQDLPHGTLVARFGAERAAWIEQAVHGMSDEPVQERERPKSMLAAKSFSPTSNLTALQRWFGVLAEELSARMATDETLYNRRPRSLVVHYRGGPSTGPGGGGSERSKTCSMPRGPGGEGSSAAHLAGAAFALFKARCMQEALPCNRLAISAGDFFDLPSSSSLSAITRFLVPQKPGGGSGSGGGGGGASAGCPEAEAAAAGGDEWGRVAAQAAGPGSLQGGERATAQPARLQEAQQAERVQQGQQMTASQRAPHASVVKPITQFLVHRGPTSQLPTADLPPQEAGQQQKKEQKGQQQQEQRPQGTAPAVADLFGRASKRQRRMGAPGHATTRPVAQQEQQQEQEAEQRDGSLTAVLSVQGPGSACGLLGRGQGQGGLHDGESTAHPPIHWPGGMLAEEAAASGSTRTGPDSQQHREGSGEGKGGDGGPIACSSTAGGGAAGGTGRGSGGAVSRSGVGGLDGRRGLDEWRSLEGLEGQAPEDSIPEGVDVAEQLRILKEIELGRVLLGRAQQAQRGGGAGRVQGGRLQPPQQPGGRGKRQQGIAAFMQKGS